jgi:hypothetical protein
VAQSSPCGLLLRESPPGFGKATALVHLILLQVAAGRRVGAYVPTNGAATNITQRLIKASEKLYGKDRHLIIRQWSESLELRVLERCDANNLKEVSDSKSKQRN